MIISADNHVFPSWAPDWLGGQVESPDCGGGTHTRLRWLAKWLTIYLSEHPGEARRWLYYAAQNCVRAVPDGELDRLLIWAAGLFDTKSADIKTGNPLACKPALADLEEIYRVAVAGPRLAEFRAASPGQAGDSRRTDQILDAWGRYAGQADPLICFGADDRFWTRPHSAVRGILHVHQQIVPSPMRAPAGLTADGRWSQHTKDGTGQRMVLVTEFDFTKTTPKGQPTIWLPLLEAAEQAGITALDIQAALLTKLATERPLWMTVFSGGKSLQGWFPCRGEDEDQLHHWFNSSARRLGADPATWCKSQFVRMPDGSRVNRQGQSVRQAIQYYNPSVL